MNKQRRYCRIPIAVAFALMLAPAIVHADINGFADFSQFTLNQRDSGSPATIPSPGTIQLTNSGISEGRSIFYDSPQSISQFTASFSYEALTADSLDNSGAAFVVQNSSAGAHAMGDFFFAYSNISNSAAVTLESFNASGLYTNGTIGGGSAGADPVKLFSGDAINVTLTYNGTTLHETLTDTITSSTFSTTYLINIPNAIGGSTAFVGFTAGTYPLSFGGTGEQIFSNFHFAAIPEPSSLALFAVGGLGLLACVRRRRAGYGMASDTAWRALSLSQVQGSEKGTSLIFGEPRGRKRGHH